MKRLVSASALAWLCSAHSAQAKSGPPPNARLELSKGPETEQCVDRQSLARAVEARLQRRVFVTRSPATLSLKVSITRERRGWSAALTLYDGAGGLLGRRSLVTEAAHCSALDDPLALVVALLVDSPLERLRDDREAEAAPRAPGASAGSDRAPLTVSTPRSDAGSESSASPSEPPRSIRLPRDAPAPREPWRFRLSAAANAAIGVLPGLAPGIELGFAAQGPKLPELRLFAAAYAPREQRRPGADAGARFDALTLGFELCPLQLILGAARWFGCAGQSLGRLRAAAFGFDDNLSSSRMTYALLARSGVQFDLTARWAARVAVRAELPLARQVFGYGAREGGQRDLYEPSAVSGGLDFGIVVNL